MSQVWSNRPQDTDQEVKVRLQSILYVWLGEVGEEMKIVFLHELDTGFMAQTLKPAFEALGHQCIIMQGWKTHLEGDNNTSIDYLLTDIKKDDVHIIEQHFKDTDFFILRAGDALLKDSHVLPYINKHNSCYRLHGHDLTFLGRPYKLRYYRTKKLDTTVVTYNDPTFYQHFRSFPVFIERPIDLSLIPKKKKTGEVYAVSTPTSMTKKGGDMLAHAWKTKDIGLKIVSAYDRLTALDIKAGASYAIDNVDPTYLGGPYGMNSVEAWLLSMPVFSNYTHIVRATCPQITQLVNHATIHNVQQLIEHHEVDKKQLTYAKQYAIRTHDSKIVAQQYIALAEHLMEE